MAYTFSFSDNIVRYLLILNRIARFFNVVHLRRIFQETEVAMQIYVIKDAGSISGFEGIQLTDDWE